MARRFWRLSEAGPDNLGPACTDDGLLLGRTHAASAVAHVKSRVAGWDDESIRRGAMAIIQGLEYALSGGQRQLLLRKSDRYGISGIPRKAVDDLFALLREDGAA